MYTDGGRKTSTYRDGMSSTLVLGKFPMRFTGYTKPVDGWSFEPDPKSGKFDVTDAFANVTGFTSDLRPWLKDADPKQPGLLTLARHGKLMGLETMFKGAWDISGGALLFRHELLQTRFTGRAFLHQLHRTWRRALHGVKRTVRSRTHRQSAQLVSACHLALGANKMHKDAFVTSAEGFGRVYDPYGILLPGPEEEEEEKKAGIDRRLEYAWFVFATLRNVLTRSAALVLPAAGEDLARVAPLAYLHECIRRELRAVGRRRRHAASAEEEEEEEEEEAAAYRLPTMSPEMRAFCVHTNEFRFPDYRDLFEASGSGATSVDVDSTFRRLVRATAGLEENLDAASAAAECSSNSVPTDDTPRALVRDIDCRLVAVLSTRVAGTTPTLKMAVDALQDIQVGDMGARIYHELYIRYRALLSFSRSKKPETETSSGLHAPELYLHALTSLADAPEWPADDPTTTKWLQSLGDEGADTKGVLEKLRDAYPTDRWPGFKRRRSNSPFVIAAELRNWRTGVDPSPYAQLVTRLRTNLPEFRYAIEHDALTEDDLDILTNVAHMLRGQQSTSMIPFVDEDRLIRGLCVYALAKSNLLLLRSKPKKTPRAAGLASDLVARKSAALNGGYSMPNAGDLSELARINRILLDPNSRVVTADAEFIDSLWELSILELGLYVHVNPENMEQMLRNYFLSVFNLFALLYTSGEITGHRKGIQFPQLLALFNGLDKAFIHSLVDEHIVTQLQWLYASAATLGITYPAPENQMVQAVKDLKEFDARSIATSIGIQKHVFRTMVIGCSGLFPTSDADLFQRISEKASALDVEVAAARERAAAARERAAAAQELSREQDALWYLYGLWKYAKRSCVIAS